MARRFDASGSQQRYSVSSEQAAPTNTHPTCTHGIPGAQMMCHRLPAMPSKSQPQLNGSERLCSAKVIIENTVASANAIQQPRPIGMSAAVVVRN